MFAKTRMALSVSCCSDSRERSSFLASSKRWGREKREGRREEEREGGGGRFRINNSQLQMSRNAGGRNTQQRVGWREEKGVGRRVAKKNEY